MFPSIALICGIKENSREEKSEISFTGHLRQWRGGQLGGYLCDLEKKAAQLLTGAEESDHEGKKEDRNSRHRLSERT